MTATDTAHRHWSTIWSGDVPDKWVNAAPDVAAFAERLAPGSRVLDLGCGVGRHALMYARMGHTVSALDAAPEGVAKLSRVATSEGLGVTATEGRMDALPYADGAFDLVLSFNVIYHGDGAVLQQTISEISRVLRPGGWFQGTMLSKRSFGTRFDMSTGVEVSPNAWTFPHLGGDKVHPHYFCSAAELVRHFCDFELLSLEDREHDTPGSWHWHMIAEKSARR